MGYTSLDTLSVLQTLVRELFKSNAILDNISYSLATDLGYPVLSDNVHHRIAHAYGKQSDIITDFLDLRGDRILRGNEVVEPKKYDNVLNCLKDIIEVQNRLEDILKECIITSADNLDLAVEDMLRSYYKDVLVLYTKQANKLYNAALKYSEDGILPLFDVNCDNYFIVEVI